MTKNDRDLDSFNLGRPKPSAAIPQRLFARVIRLNGAGMLEAETLVDTLEHWAHRGSSMQETFAGVGSLEQAREKIIFKELLFHCLRTQERALQRQAARWKAAAFAYENYFTYGWHPQVLSPKVRVPLGLGVGDGAQWLRMSTTTERSQESEYVVPSANSQEVQPSPLALLAATCSKIGSPTDSPADDSGGGDGANGDASPAKTNSATVLPAGAGELVAQYVQTPTMGVLNPDGTVTPMPSPTVKAAQQAQQAVFSPGTQFVAQVTPSGQITYNAIPQIQNIQIDGQEAIFIPASFTGGQQAIQLTGGGPTLLANQVQKM
ncbi:hypothetical protein HPB51_014604 [Rhipicephalus microplus]|uniref:Uncharacterized protein n=1 Tax=Rhipicephalus microplus TaxID=6941 RepID=A0A9J6F3R5_RHIMP|nr:hypothetical protein HPB51_014604 [Rhipicephalus microplus]